jgi:endoglucanase
VAARIGAAASWGRRHGVPVVMGEFGASVALNAPARLGWLAAVRRACEANGIGWALWGYDDVMGFGIDPRKATRSTMDRATQLALGLAVRP